MNLIPKDMSSMEKLFNKNEINMIDGHFFKRIFIYALPIMFSGMLQLLYNACDLIVCNSFGSAHSVAAISSTNSLVNLIINLFIGLSVGANVLMARSVGANDREKGDRVAHTAMAFSVVIGVIIGLFGVFTSRYFLTLMETPDDVIDLSSTYLMIYFIGLPFSMIYNFGASVLRATVDSKRPFYALAISGIFNVILNLIFVICFHLDVAGVAIATIIAQAISAFIVVVVMLNNKGFFTLKLKKIKFHAQETWEIIKIGVPAGLQGMIFSLSNVLIQKSVNNLGTNIMDGNGAACSLEGFIYQAMNAVAQSCVAFVSANYGAKRFQNIKKVIMCSLVIVCINWAIMAIIAFAFANPLIRLYVDDEEAIAAGLSRLRLIAGMYFLCGIMDTLAYSMRGLGYSSVPAIVSLCGACGFRIVWIYTIFTVDKYHNLTSLVISYPISWLITSLVHLLCLLIIYSVVKKKNMITNTNI